MKSFFVLAAALLLTSCYDSRAQTVDKATSDSLARAGARVARDYEERVTTLAEETRPRQHFETVTRVIDGDTFVIGAEWSPWPLEWRIRLRGVDTPEKGALAHCEVEKARSARATAAATQLLEQSLMRVRLRDVSHDKYGGRLDAYVVLANGRELGAELVRLGVAKPYNGNGPKPNWCY